MHTLRRKRARRITAIIGVLSMFCCYPAIATPATPPDAGTILRGQKDNLLPPPGKQEIGIEIGKQNEKLPDAAGPKLLVGGLHITGQTPYSADKLLPLVSDSIGKELTLGELEGLAGRITKYFREQGYPVANAYIPIQDIKDGMVEITVIVGQYGRIDIRNDSRLKTKIAAEMFSGLRSGDYIKTAQLERALLLFNDLPGVAAKATLAPGTVSGTADLIVNISNTSKVSGQITADNWGNRFTGKNRIGFNMNINNPSGGGDLINLGGAYAGTGMNDYSISYILPTGKEGTKLGVGYSRMHYELGKEFASLNASGIAKTTSIFETFALRRSRGFNLTGRIEYASKQLIDRIDSIPSMSDKRADVLSASLTGNSSDQFGGSGMNSFTLTHSRGRLSMKSADAVSNDTNTQTAGSYNKTNLNLYRAQAINSRLNLYLSFAGQLASKNLDSSEKLQIGGPTAVRAYPISEAPSDQGYIFTGELRWNLPTPSFQLAAFYDNGKAILNKNPWAGAGVNKRVLAGAGLGLIWNRTDDFFLRLDYAWKITNDPATSDTDKNGRLWLQGVKYF